MNTANALSSESCRKILEEFVSDNADFERLESLANQFNIFEVIGAVRQELRHSDFLAYLLSPEANHGLGDIFSRKLLQKAVANSKNSGASVNVIDLDIWNLEESEVLREWQNIDIVFTNEKNDLVVAIENKIGTTEHSDQLGRYWSILQQHHPNKRKLGLYLTPDGEQPSHPSFLAISYGQIASIVEDLVERRQSVLNSDVRTLLLHYAQMLRRHIVSESEIAELCRRIYAKHKQALDLIFDHRPDDLAARAEFLKSLIASRADFIEDFSAKSYIRFGLDTWETAKLKSGQGWTRSGRMLLFEFHNLDDSLRLKLVIGPGPHEIREPLFQVAVRNQPPFKPQSKALNRQWNEIFGRNFLSAKAYQDCDEDELRDKIRSQWEQFLKNDLVVVAKLIGEVVQSLE
jgi:hypothetical protein